MEVARSGLWAPGWYVYSKLRYWAYFSQQSVATEYLHLIEDNDPGRKDYYLDPHDSDSTVPVTRADVYNRLVLFRLSIWLLFLKSSAKSEFGCPYPVLRTHKGANKSQAKELPNISSTMNTLCYVNSITDWLRASSAYKLALPLRERLFGEEIGSSEEY